MKCSYKHTESNDRVSKYDAPEQPAPYRRVIVRTLSDNTWYLQFITQNGMKIVFLT